MATYLQKRRLTRCGNVDSSTLCLEHEVKKMDINGNGVIVEKKTEHDEKKLKMESERLDEQRRTMEKARNKRISEEKRMKQINMRNMYHNKQKRG